MLQICYLMLFAKTKFSRKFPDLQYCNSVAMVTLVPSSRFPLRSMKASNPDARSFNSVSLCAPVVFDALCWQNSVFEF